MNELKWCIDYLKQVNNINSNINMDDFSLFRALLNITMPVDLKSEFYLKQDKVLQDYLKTKKIVNESEFNEGINLYKGDITLIKVDAIVNACNNKMLGCFVPGHHCIDNAIHSFAGLELRKEMMEIMNKQGHDEENGKCKVTSGYNLPSKYVFHTVGPIYNNSKQNEIDLKNCYYSCLQKADEMKLNSICFCSLSTGVFGYPINKASRIAYKTVKDYLENENKNIKKVIFDVFSDSDYYEYKRTIEEIN